MFFDGAKINKISFASPVITIFLEIFCKDKTISTRVNIIIKIGT